ncbi:hypothetical protein OG342_27720 [Streptomyces bobili]|uniref:hypothetical protein n=1 Tax=Streptomyces bobili TaxID=67280 RepID=UPI00224D1C0E|nr:hypothetical protein [Streptomyces bobili]MCX5526605.1 hypothetical protein [Streptomyces bobili]
MRFPEPRPTREGGNYSDHAFEGGETTGANGQTGIRPVADEYGNLVTAMPKNVW